MAKSKRFPFKHEEAGLLLHRFLVGRDDFAVHGRMRTGVRVDVLAERASGNRERLAVDLADAQQLAQYRGHAAGAMEPFAQVFARRLHVHQQRYVTAVFHPVARRDLDAGVTRHRDQVWLGIRRATDRGDRRDGIEECLAREDLRGAQILVRELDDASSGFIRDLAAFAIGRGNGRASGQRKAEHFGDGVHRRGRAHGVAVAERRRRRGGRIQELLLGDLPGGELAARTPDHGS